MSPLALSRRFFLALLSSWVLLEMAGDLLTLLVNLTYLMALMWSSCATSCFASSFLFWVSLLSLTSASCFLVDGGFATGAWVRSELSLWEAGLLYFLVGFINWLSSSKCFRSDGSFLGSWKLNGVGWVSFAALLLRSSVAANSLCIRLKSGTGFGAGGLKLKDWERAPWPSVFCSATFFSWASILGGSFESVKLTSAFFLILLSLSFSCSSTMLL